MAPKTHGGLDPLDGLNSPIVQGLLAAVNQIGVLLQTLAGPSSAFISQINLAIDNVPEHLGTDPDVIAAYQTPLTLLLKGAEKVRDAQKASKG